MKLDGHVIELDNMNKLFFPNDGITKGEMIEYYSHVSPIMLPHMVGRPLTMHRFPDGIHGESFYQKETPGYFPSWIIRSSMPKEDQTTTNYVICDSTATLVYLASQGCITSHLWLSRYDQPHYPDLLIFDLDPSGNDFEPVRKSAMRLRSLLTDLGLTPFVKTSGSRGLHVTCPLDRRADFGLVGNFAKRIAQQLIKLAPEYLTIEQRKVNRKGKVFIDTLRNGYAQTAVAPYALRAKPGAPVATPLEWGELEDTAIQPQSFTLRNIFQLLEKRPDPWANMWQRKASIEIAWSKLQAKGR
jgi:bifunctional non-homologous end joining protein LigD